MFETLLQNIELISILIFAYLVALGTNTLLGIYYNINALKESFQKEKLFTGLVRGGIILISGLLITTVISLLPEILNLFHITAPENLFENISIIAMATVLTSTIIRYLTDATKKFYAILNSHTVIESTEPITDVEEE